jgi:hypothetical protein
LVECCAHQACQRPTTRCCRTVRPPLCGPKPTVHRSLTAPPPHAPNFSCHPTCATCALSLHLYGVEEKPICLTAPCHRALTALLLPTLSRHCVPTGCCLKTLQKIPSCTVSPPSHHPKVAAKHHPAALMPSAIRLYEQLRGGSLPPATSDPTFTSMCSALERRPSLTPPASWSLACAS